MPQQCNYYLGTILLIGDAMELMNKISRIAAHILLVAGAGFLAIMMFLTMTDVVLRYIFRSPLTGAYEVIEYMMAVVVPFGIVYCAYEKGHVSVDVVFDHLPKRLQDFMSCITSLVILCLFLLVAWQNILYIHETYASRLTTAVLYIPSFPFVGVIAIGMVALCLVLFIDFLNFLLKMVQK